MKRHLPTYLAACLACLTILAGVYLDSLGCYSQYKYYQVHDLNRYHQQEHIDACIPYPVEDHNWEETANAIGIPVDSLSITAYLGYISK